MAMHGRRLDALWKLSTNSALKEEDMIRALLTIAAAALRPGVAFSAHLLRIEAGQLLVEETISRGPHAAWLPNNGDAIGVNASLFREAVLADATRSCADIRAEPELADLRAGGETRARSFIAAPFRAGDAKYVVAMVSTHAFPAPFDRDDEHFMESLVTLLAARLVNRPSRRAYGPLMNCGPLPLDPAGLVPHGSMP
jgi:GAF domain-containing protein